MTEALQQNETPAEARRATLEEFSKLPSEAQTAFLKRTYEQPELRSNPELLHTAMKSEIETHIAAQHKLELAAMLQLSPQLAPTGKEQEVTRTAAIESLATAQVEVKQALDRGETAQQIEAKAKSSENVATAVTVQTVVQERKEEQQRDRVAQNDEVHREKVGLAEPKNEPHPFAHLVPDHLKAAIGAAMGAQNAVDMHETGPSNAAKAASEAKGRV